MTIKCRVCKRKMTHTGVLMHGAGWFAQPIKDSALALFAKMFLGYLQNLTRSEWDNGLAEIANAFGLKCPKCKSESCWDPAPEKIKNQSKKNDAVSL